MTLTITTCQLKTYDHHHQITKLYLGRIENEQLHCCSKHLQNLNQGALKLLRWSLGTSKTFCVAFPLKCSYLLHVSMSKCHTVNAVHMHLQRTLLTLLGVGWFLINNALILSVRANISFVPKQFENFPLDFIIYHIGLSSLY